MASRIANAEAAVEQAEQAAAEAVRSQDEASRAATMADKHYLDAADQSETVYRVSFGLQCHVQQGLTCADLGAKCIRS